MACARKGNIDGFNSFKVPLKLKSLISRKYPNVFIVASSAGIYSLFPLLFKPNEFITKSTIMAIYILISLQYLNHRLRFLERLYIVSFIGITLLQFMIEAVLPKYQVLFILIVSAINDYQCILLSGCYL